jgi:ABC-type nitrate/sulfonate/bicarbonate transport system permease component
MATIVKRDGAVAQRRPRIGPRVSQINVGVWRLLIFVVLVAGWWLLALVAGKNFIPTPPQTIAAAGQIIADGSLPSATLDTIFVFLTGYVVAAVVSIPLGLLMGGIKVLGAAFEPYVDALSAMPRVSFIPLIIVFLGLGFQAKIVIVFFGAAMPILINTYTGVLNCDGELVEMARSAGATDLQIFRKIMLPASLPYITAGLRVGASLALINTVVAELYTAVKGLGGLLSVYGNSFRMAPYFVVVFVLGAIGLAVMQSLKILERNTSRWRYNEHG